MTGSSSKLLPIQGKWHQERKPKTKSKTWGNKNPKTIYTHKRIAIRWHQSTNTKARFKVFTLLASIWGILSHFPAPRVAITKISNGIHSVYSQNGFCNPCKTYKLMAMERERDTANLIKITMDQILTVNWMGKWKIYNGPWLKSPWIPSIEWEGNG